jgi:hypothetical protein
MSIFMWRGTGRDDFEAEIHFGFNARVAVENSQQASLLMFDTDFVKFPHLQVRELLHEYPQSYQDYLSTINDLWPIDIDSQNISSASPLVLSDPPPASPASQISLADINFVNSTLHAF